MTRGEEEGEDVKGETWAGKEEGEDVRGETWASGEEEGRMSGERGNLGWWRGGGGEKEFIALPFSPFI